MKRDFFVLVRFYVFLMVKAVLGQHKAIRSVVTICNFSVELKKEKIFFEVVSKMPYCVDFCFDFGMVDDGGFCFMDKVFLKLFQRQQVESWNDLSWNCSVEPLFFSLVFSFLREKEIKEVYLQFLGKYRQVW